MEVWIPTAARLVGRHNRSEPSEHLGSLLKKKKSGIWMYTALKSILVCRSMRMNVDSVYRSNMKFQFPGHFGRQASGFALTIAVRQSSWHVGCWLEDPLGPSWHVGCWLEDPWGPNIATGSSTGTSTGGFSGLEPKGPHIQSHLRTHCNLDAFLQPCHADRNDFKILQVSCLRSTFFCVFLV